MMDLPIEPGDIRRLTGPEGLVFLVPEPGYWRLRIEDGDWHLEQDNETHHYRYLAPWNYESGMCMLHIESVSDTAIDFDSDFD